MSDEGLRPGWRKVRFGDVVQQVKDKVDPEMAGIDRYVAGEHMDTDDLRIRRWGRVGDGYLGPAFNMRFKPGQVLYGSRRTYLRKVAVADFEGICANTTFVVESATEDLMPTFLPYVMTTESFHEHSIKQSKGSVNPYINFSDLKWYEFALPALDEQAQMVDLLKTFDCLDSALNGSEAASAVLLRSQMQDLLAEATDWSAVRCDDVLDVQVGKKLSPERRQGLRPRPYLRAAHLRGTHIDLTDLKEMDFTPEEDETLAIRAGDVLLVEGGNRDSVAAPTFVEWTPDPPLYIQNSVVRLRSLDPRQVDPRFVYWQWRARFETGEFEREAVGTKLYHFGPGRAEATPLAVPPSAVQRRWVHQLDATFEAAAAVTRHRERSRMARSAAMNTLLGGPHVR